MIVEQSENLAYQARSLSTDASGHACLTEILTWKARGQKIRILRKRTKATNICLAMDARETMIEHRTCRIPHLAEHSSVVTRRGQPPLKASNSSEKPDYLHIAPPISP
jgi:hypothetical protein